LQQYPLWFSVQILCVLVQTKGIRNKVYFPVSQCLICQKVFVYWATALSRFMNVNGKLKEGSMEIDSDNNLERFKTGSGDEEAVEIHDFQIGITGIRFFGGEKCYIKSQIKANLPDMGTHKKETFMFDLVQSFLIWVAADQPVKDTSFLSNKILGLCGDLPIYWLQPTYYKENEKFENSVISNEYKLSIGGKKRLVYKMNVAPNLQRRGEESEGGAMTFDPMLDHLGICCSECQRSYTHCQRICEPLRGHWPWPYNYRGCQVACRVILPCRWWVARILGVV
uniref:Leukocyte cell-derived chemotaxin 1 n=1 Tax=Myripristis murdjan TaxID=586833 RepID=A0A668AYH7_9TELE